MPMTYLCEYCGSKFQSEICWVGRPCENYQNGLECGFPIAPILNLRISGIEKEKEEPRYVDCSGLSDSDIDQLRKVWAAKNK